MKFRLFVRPVLVGALALVAMESTVCALPSTADLQGIMARMAPGASQGSLSFSYFREPYGAKNVQGLADLLPTLHERDHQLQIAALLYRYGNEPGTAKLAELLKEGSPMAAAIFAAANDAAKLPLILKALEDNNTGVDEEDDARHSKRPR